MIRFRLLGALELRGEGSRSDARVSGAKRLGLMAHLALEGRRGPVRRETLTGLFWPESDVRSARNALSNMLFQLRRVLGAGVVESEGAEELRLARGAVWCDALEFEAAVEDGRLVEALELYRGDLLAGFHVPGGASELDHWMDAERARLRRLAIDAARRRSDEAEGWGDVAEAIRRARWICEIDPFDEPAARRLIATLEAAGDRAGALREYERFADRLERDLGAGPSAATLALRARLRVGAGDRGGSGGTAAAGPDSSGRGSPRTDTAGRPEAGAGARPASDDGAAADLPVHTVAVLPFANLGGASEAEPFVAGLHDDLVTELSRVRSLRVIARMSVMRYRGTHRPVGEIARELGVGTIVEGGVQAAGGRIRVNVQVIDARSSSHRWAERFDRELSAETMFSIQTELAERITTALRADLDEDPTRGRAPATEDLQAYRLYVKGRGYLDQRTEIGILKAIAFFERAVRLDDGYALAWSGLADAVSLLHDYGFGDGAHDLGVAESAVARALWLDPGLAEAHASRGLVLCVRRQGARALRSLARATELRPGYADAHNWQSWQRLVYGIAGPALQSARRAVELDPVAPEPVSNLSLSLLANGRPDEALHAARRVTELQPDWTTGRFYEALALHALGRFDEEIHLLDGLNVEWAGTGPLGALGIARAAAGREPEARAALDRLERAGDAFSAGLVLLALGERERALGHMERVESWSYWPTLAFRHLYREELAPLRATPLDAELLRRMTTAWGLNEAEGVAAAEGPGAPAAQPGAPSLAPRGGKQKG